MEPGLITPLRLTAPSSSQKCIYDSSPILACSCLYAFVQADKGKPDEDTDALTQQNEGTDADREVEGHGGPEVLRYLHLFTEWLVAADHVAMRLRGLARAEGWTDLQRNLKLSLIKLDVTWGAVEQAAGAWEGIIAYLKHSVDQRKVQDEVRKSAKGWLKSHCKYDHSQQRHFTSVHAEAGLMALVSAIHETGGKVREVIRGHDALRQLETVRAIWRAALPQTLIRRFPDAQICHRSEQEMLSGMPPV